MLECYFLVGLDKKLSRLGGGAFFVLCAGVPGLAFFVVLFVEVDLAGRKVPSLEKVTWSQGPLTW